MGCAMQASRRRAHKRARPDDSDEPTTDLRGSGDNDMLGSDVEGEDLHNPDTIRYVWWCGTACANSGVC